jgi:chromosome segregation ATPase
MSSEIEQFMFKLVQLRSDLESSWEKMGEASSMAFDFDGEFRQEISTDLEGLQGQLRKLADNLDSVLEEARTLRDDSELMEESMRKVPDDEENYKVDAEHIQEEMREDKES